MLVRIQPMALLLTPLLVRSRAQRGLQRPVQARSATTARRSTLAQRLFGIEVARSWRGHRGLPHPGVRSVQANRPTVGPPPAHQG